MTGLIAALVTTDIAQAQRRAGAVAPPCGMVKLGLECFLANGPPRRGRLRRPPAPGAAIAGGDRTDEPRSALVVGRPITQAADPRAAAIAIAAEIGA